MRRHVLTAALLTLLLAPVPGAGQETPGEADVRQKLERVREGAGSEAAARLEEALERAREAGVPAGPVLDKALEGIAKGVPTDRLMPAVESYVGRLGRAAEVLGDGRPPAELVAGADALGRGVSEADLRDVDRSAGAGDRAIALVVLGDLVEMGIPAERAAGAVREALSAGRGGEALLDLPGMVRRKLRGGVPPARAVEQARRDLRRGPPGGPPMPPGAGAPGGDRPDGPPNGADPPVGGAASTGGS